MTRSLSVFSFNLLNKRNLLYSVFSCKRCLASDTREQKFYITTPIFYVNAAPHIGHLHTAVLADVLSRWKRLQGVDVLFTTGTDEHGLKIQQAATKSSIQPQQYCDQISSKFKEVFSLAGISYNDYIRTTENRHKNEVITFWNTLRDNGYIYKDSYKGWYSVSDEEFVVESDVQDGTDNNGTPCKISRLSGHPVVWTQEENYLFRLSEFKLELTEWLDQKVIQPQGFETEMREWIENLKDISVSRPSQRLTWGIPVPDDPSQTIYVWLDALVNYYTSAKSYDLKFWPPDVHVVGKDILKFHAVYWPAFLLAANLPLPRRILCHSHWLVEERKMSKSLGNVIDPCNKMEKYSCDGFRYFLMKCAVPHADLNYLESTVLDVVNADIVNNLGNLLSRCSGKVLNPRQVIPVMSDEACQAKMTAEEREIFQSIFSLLDEVSPHYESGNIYKALQLIIHHVSWANKMFHDHEPWELIKVPSESEHLQCVQHMVYETLRVCTILLQPVIPSMAVKILNRINVPSEERTLCNCNIHINDSVRPLGQDVGVLLKRIKK
ncbi:hypothetical protein FSP39_009126 [Pinctada imbricata]|uniref:Methionine--tRNA ligase, mitochondrial n=1 Tax=Pinctada imbricata TaxID=66713 RepID=A0AA88XZU8_PINIB|nr:hypothetical protein FSP39_009126 [Pinctada imbricata]